LGIRHQIKLPKLGETTQVAMIAEWLCELGERIEPGFPLVLVETDKTDTELPSPVGGFLVAYLAAVRDEVAVGEPICVIEE
jgi:2-oxoglutarate dehydrogenase E2 component (dihydrolipoamide succinyltransferase)